MRRFQKTGANSRKTEIDLKFVQRARTAPTSAGPRGPSTLLETFALKNGRRR